MKKSNYSYLLAIMLLAVLCIGFVSCGGDDDGGTSKVTTGRIVGLVSDYANSNTPVAGATVTLVQQGEVKVTGSDGRFEFSNLRPGSYTVEVSANNFQVNTQMAYVVAGEYTHCDFQLQRTSQNVEISPMSLTFGKNISQLSFYLVNNTNSLLTYSFSNVPDYMQLTPSTGTISAKGRQAIIASIPNRSSVTVSGSQIIIVHIGNDSYSLTLNMTNNNVTPDSGGGSQQGGDDQPSGGGESSDGDVTRGLQACYNFDDGTANNSVSGGVNGTLYGTSSTYIVDTPNNKGKALWLQNKEYVNLPKNILSGATSFSVSMWVKDFGTGPFFVTKAQYPEDGAPEIFVAENGLFKVRGRGPDYPVYKSNAVFGLSATNYQGTGWHMITVTLTGKSVRLYIDGNLVGSDQIDSVQSNGSSMTIGGVNKDTSGNSWPTLTNVTMKVDNVRIYSVSLTEAEVQNLYNYEKK